jgi:regulator of sigma E protease
MDILIFLVALSVLVLVHELGHFLMAKRADIRVEEFGLGLPPKILGKKIGETIFSLNWLPIGGFCKLFGEDPPSSAKGGLRRGKVALWEEKRSFYFKSPVQKGGVVLGGVIMNLVLAVVIFTGVYGILGVPTETNKVKIVGVAKGSPASNAALREGDWIKAVNGVEVRKPEELTNEVGKYKGQEVSLKVESLKVEREIKILVRENPPVGEGGMGVAISNTEMVKVKWYEFYKGIHAGFKEAYFWGRVILDGLGKMIGSLLRGQVPKDVSGPLGMFQATSSIKKSQGILAVIHFFGVVSVNLAIVNVLPFPALDGGRIIFVIYEMIFKKRANQKFEIAVNNLGMAVLLSLILLITLGDVVRIIRK